MKRRTFLRTVTGIAASAAFPHFAIGKLGKSANGKLNIAFIGSGGWIAQRPYNQGCSEENLVTFCDVDREHCPENMKNWRTTQPGVHRNVTLEGNRIVCTDESGIFAVGVDGLTVRNNTIEQSGLRGSRPHGKEPIWIQDCARAIRK